MPQRKVMLVEFNPSGGLFQFALQLGEALAARGHEVELVTGPRPELASGVPGMTVSAALPTWHASAGASDPRLRRRLRRAVRAVRYHLSWAVLLWRVLVRRPQVVQLAGGRFPVDGLAAALLTRLPHKPVVVTLAHAPIPWNEQRPTGEVYKQAPLLHRTLGVGYRSVDAVLVLGASSAADLASLWPDVRHVHIVPHGDEGVFLRSEPSPAASTQPLVLFFGTLQAYKGLDLLMDAFALVQDRYPSARLLVAGAASGDTDVEALRRRAASSSGVELRLGYVPLQDVADLFAQARCVVAPYRRANASGVVALAQTCARPVVATRVGDLVTAVHDGQTGLLVAPDDPAELAEAVLRLLEDPEEASRLGDNGRSAIRASASWEAVAEAVESVYEQCLASRDTSGRARPQ